MGTEAWVFLVIIAATGAAVGGYVHGKRVGVRRGMMAAHPGKPPKMDMKNPKDHSPVINPRVAAAAMAITAAQGKPQKV